jgi:hypothetical protein
MNAAQMTDAELMAFEPAEAQFREADQLERWLDRRRGATGPEAG